MHSPLLESLIANYQWQLSLYALIGITLLPMISKPLLMLVPTFRKNVQLNANDFATKMERPSYAANHKWNRKWGGLYMVVAFGLILPFCLTSAPQPWWKVAMDLVIILMFYDFFYYFTHRFLFHDNGFLGGPLLKMHAIHHRQLNPCRRDSSYIHPLEVAIGLGLYVLSIFVLARIMGNFGVVTIVLTFTAFTQINLHNHDLWESDHFPFRYVKTMSQMHHNHHATFTGGNFATLTLLYDWMFGTLDYSNRPVRKPKGQAQGSQSGI
jgi:sterol desaturase/sphingolipid hydroxylase (fatty acid hydroxylase superfamily)